MITHTVLSAIHRLEDGTVVEIDPDKVTPGVFGFAFTAIFALAVILIGLDMYRRVRRMRYRVEIREEIERELSEQQHSDEGPADENQSR